MNTTLLIDSMKDTAKLMPIPIFLILILAGFGGFPEATGIEGVLTVTAGILTGYALCVFCVYHIKSATAG